MKTKEELNQLKLEYETIATKLQELTEKELKQVTGGLEPSGCYSKIVKFPNPVKATWGQIGGFTNYLPKENDDIR